MELSAQQQHTPFTPLSAKAFRRRVLRPVEGVFLFHPRALERLIHEDLDRGLLARQVPALSYYLIPREVFLVALEDENPDALSVIEGLDLPNYVILLPMPLARMRVATEPERLLHRYWGWRFEAEVARAWQQARDDNRDRESFGPQGLIRLIGAAAFWEIRAVLEHDRHIVLEQDDLTVTRHFVGLVARLRYFAPAVRGYYFPALRNWTSLDAWMASGGLDLPPLGPSHRYPLLLSRSRPPTMALGLQRTLELPRRLEYGDNDPDRVEEPARAEAPPAPTPPGTGLEVSLSAPQRLCLAALEGYTATAARRRLRTTMTQWAGRLLGRLLFSTPPRKARDGAKPQPRGPSEQRYRAGAFARSARASAQAETHGRLLRALRLLVQASWHYQRLGPGSGSTSDPVRARVDARIAGLTEALAGRSLHAWNATEETCRTLEELLHRLTQGQVREGARAVPSRLLRHLEQALTAPDTRFVRLRWLSWVRTLGRAPLWEPLPYQGRLKALRAMDAALAQLSLLPWTGAAVERYSAPIETAREGLIDDLQTALGPTLDQALAGAHMVPRSHRQTVALGKLRAELLDVLQERYHLRFGDVRDVVARNDLRLDDLTPRELVGRDRLLHLDRHLGRLLPGVYRRGEVYLKVFHRLSAVLFGTHPGRLVTRHLLLPFGATLVLLEVTDHLYALFAGSGSALHLTRLWSVVAGGLLLNGLFYTNAGRLALRRLGRALQVFFTRVLVHGLRNLLQWEPVARLLRNPAVRELSRYLVEPLAIGLVTIIPAAVTVFAFVPGDQELPWPVFVLGFVVGSFLRHTQPGRNLLDSVMVQLVRFWGQFRDTLVMGLFRLVVDVFKRFSDAFEQGLYRIDEMARYRADEPALGVAVKSAVRPVWGALSYVIRFYVSVLIEPQVNPIKHFPVVTVSHKLILPALPALTSAMLVGLDPFLPRVVSVPFVTATILLLPGVFGFLVWELKENWKLFSANRPEQVRPVLVGRHGETLRVMLRRGFHSGTIPRAFDRLRRLLRESIERGTTPRVRLRRAEGRLLRTREELERLRERELIASLQAQMDAGRLALRRIEAGSLYLASSSMELGLVLWPNPRSQVDVEPLRLTLSYRIIEGEVAGDLDLRGSVHRLPLANRQVLCDELTDFFGRCATRCREGGIARLLWLDDEVTDLPLSTRLGGLVEGVDGTNRIIVGRGR